MQDKLSVRQLMILFGTAALMPATALLPTMEAQLVGSAGWLSLLGAIPILLCACWAAKSFSQNKLENAPAFIKYILIIMYSAWTFSALVLSLRLSGARLEELYGQRMALFCTAGLVIVSIWMGLGKVSALARAAEVFYLALTVMLTGVILLAAIRVEKTNFYIEMAELQSLPLGSFAAAGLILNVFPAVILSCKVVWEPYSRHRIIGWVVAFCVAIALLLGVIIGCLGPRLAARIPSPFLIVVQGVGIKGAFQRAEALIVTAWTLSDLVLVSLLLHAGRGLAGLVLKKDDRTKICVIPVALIAFACAWVFLQDTEMLWSISSKLMPALGLILGVLVPVLLKCGQGIRRKGKM